MSPEVKDRLQTVFNLLKTGFNWGFVPTVIYLGELTYKLENVRRL